MNLTAAQITMIAGALPTVVGLASMILSAVPHPAKYDSYLGIARRIADVIAFNFGHGGASTVALAAMQGQPGAAAVAPPAVQAIAPPAAPVVKP